MTGVATADLWDERGEDLVSLAVQFQDVGGRVRFSGPVRTVLCRGDNQLVKEMAAAPGRGCVLVVDGGGALDSALMGGNIAAAAAGNGWAGVVIHGAVRDRAEIGGLDLGVKALGSNPRKSRKDGAGAVDVPVEIGGVAITPGARLWADEDGIVIEPATQDGEEA
ncbi:ribonuclease E activity regulator RraA [Brevibacterium album]|uniref:ribonuclease E activity regulator RraA n=1 Tax=Brevibacterium album TaxID=417948 RepID=UPI0003FEE6AA|nr:ribonuclease E activity regulator RraA [Brevibacterium album]